jgi:hypothetical protein
VDLECLVRGDARKGVGRDVVGEVEDVDPISVDDDTNSSGLASTPSAPELGCGSTLS